MEFERQSNQRTLETHWSMAFKTMGFLVEWQLSTCWSTTSLGNHSGKILARLLSEYDGLIFRGKQRAESQRHQRDKSPAQPLRISGSPSISRKLGARKILPSPIHPVSQVSEIKGDGWIDASDYDGYCPEDDLMDTSSG
jgi:hypothetical protein